MTTIPLTAAPSAAPSAAAGGASLMLSGALPRLAGAMVVAGLMAAAFLAMVG